MFHREKSFTALAAHEMRTPLANMRVVAETALRTSDTNARDQALTDLIGCVDQISHLQDQLLTLARIESSDLNKFREPFALVEVVDDAVAELLPVITAKKLKLKLALDSTAIFGHRFAVLTMIRNLLANSVRHTPEGGVIRVSTSGLGQDATLLVEDSGPGIPEEHRARALERFERLNAHSGPGSGLGLSIVCAVADLHGAKLDLDTSELGGLLVRVLFAGRAHQSLDDLPSNDFATSLTTTAIS
jgi:signal transduction histidine kinase